MVQDSSLVQNLLTVWLKTSEYAHCIQYQAKVYSIIIISHRIIAMNGYVKGFFCCSPYMHFTLDLFYHIFVETHVVSLSSVWYKMRESVMMIE